MVKLVEVAGIIRSKNAGPLELTLDIVFKDREYYEKVKTRGYISSSLISRLYGIPEEDILSIINFEPAAAVKITFKRPRVSGNVGETDVYGAQQHAPLLGLELPDD